MSALPWKWNMRALDVVVIIGLAYMVWLFYFHVTEKVDDYFVVNKIHISDHKKGDNPEVIYDRLIKREFSANWESIMKSADTGNAVCVARGHHQYKPRETNVRRSLDWFLERTCIIQPGEYLLTTTWTLWNDMEVVNTSNVYRVYSAEEWNEIKRREEVHPQLGVGVEMGPRRHLSLDLSSDEAILGEE